MMAPTNFTRVGGEVKPFPGVALRGRSFVNNRAKAGFVLLVGGGSWVGGRCGGGKESALRRRSFSVHPDEFSHQHHELARVERVRGQVTDRLARLIRPDLSR